MFAEVFGAKWLYTAA